MKRITLRISKEFVDFIGFKSLFRYVERVELQKIFRFDENTMFAIQEFRFFDEGFTPEKLMGIKEIGIKYIEELSQKDEKTYVCLVKTKKETKFHEILSNFDLLIDFPLTITLDYIEISLIGDESLLEQIESIIPKNKFEILKISDITSDFKPINALLTSRQLEILSYAISNGFFEIPRGIKSKEIAKTFSISVSAVNELIRKVEKKVFDNYFKTD